MGCGHAIKSCGLGLHGEPPPNCLADSPHLTRPTGSCQKMASKGRRDQPVLGASRRRVRPAQHGRLICDRLVWDRGPAFLGAEPVSARHRIQAGTVVVRLYFTIITIAQQD